MFSTLFQVGFAGAKKDELTPAQWGHGPSSILLEAAMPGGVLSLSVTVGTRAGMTVLLVQSNLQPLSTLCLGKARRREPRCSRGEQPPPSHLVSPLSSQMRWLPPSEAGSQGWKSRQFC
ncbi:hypothetical protein Nmel_006586 [Mimus melanotis]